MRRRFCTRIIVPAVTEGSLNTIYDDGERRTDFSHPIVSQPAETTGEGSHRNGGSGAFVSPGLRRASQPGQCGQSHAWPPTLWTPGNLFAMTMTEASCLTPSTPSWINSKVILASANSGGVDFRILRIGALRCQREMRTVWCRWMTMRTTQETSRLSTSVRQASPDPDRRYTH